MTALWLSLAVATVALRPAAAQSAGEGEFPFDPDRIAVSQTVQTLLEDELLSAQAKRRLAIFHGQYDRLARETFEQETSVATRATLALARYELDSPIWDDPAVPARLRAEAAFHRGELRRVLTWLADPAVQAERRAEAEAPASTVASDEKPSAEDEPARGETPDGERPDGGESRASAEAEGGAGGGAKARRDAAGSGEEAGIEADGPARAGGRLSAASELLRARALSKLGRYGEATATLRPLAERLAHERISDPAQRTAAAVGLAELATLEGRPADDYRLVMRLLGSVHQQLDQLYWPAMLAEAELLVEKDNRREAFEALRQTLRLNPRSSRAWFLLGRMAADAFNFDRVEDVIGILREINPSHPLADRLEARLRIVQKDADSALEVLRDARSRWPDNRELLALEIAAHALRYAPEAVDRGLARFENLSPGSYEAHYRLGEVLSAARQYGAAERALREAIRRFPNAPGPHVELGLLLMQYGDDEKAREALEQAAELDPFNVRAGNQLRLVRELLEYPQIETEHFVIKYREPIDRALAQDMARDVEEIYREVTGAFEHQPLRKTSLEILPDEKTFGVRITGVPDIWTIAASTGDVIALTPPRLGAGQRGNYDWYRVVRHEFVHTVTLSQTNNRIPHWFTEACAVSEEPGDRDFQTCVLLAEALAKGRLFDLSQINWAFVRPKRPKDRPLAYAQAEWMLEHITARFGHGAVLEMLELYRQGVGHTAALERATGRSAEPFMEGFRGWAERQVASWGLSHREVDPALRERLASGTPLSESEWGRWLGRHPDHPDLLRARASGLLHRAEAAAPGAEVLNAARSALLRYAAARPVDPWPYRKLLSLARRTGRTDDALTALSVLDRQAQKTGRYAAAMAELHRKAGELEAAAQALKRSLHREPYDVGLRERAATLALRRGRIEQARAHLQAATWIEPQEAIHFTRLAFFEARHGEAARAREAAEQAVKLAPDSPAAQFLSDAEASDR